MTGTFGTACGNGTKMAGRRLRPMSNSLGIWVVFDLPWGHFVWHSPQPVHRFSSTERAFLRIFTSKLPM